MSDRTWIILAALFAGASVVLYVLREIVTPIWHHSKLRDPIDLHFVVTKRGWADLPYLVQDDQEHSTRDIVYPAHTDDLYMQLQYSVKTSFTQIHLGVHFLGDQDKCPYIEKWHLHFIKRGRNEKTPETDETHYVDHHRVYHITDKYERTKGDHIECGFKINTQEAGIYYLHFEISADGVSSIHTLMVYVEDVPHTKVRCFDHTECFVAPKIAN